MVAQANRKAVSGRRSKAERRGGRQGSGRSAEQLASKIRARRSAWSWTKTGSRPGPLRKKKAGFRKRSYKVDVVHLTDVGGRFNRVHQPLRFLTLNLAVVTSHTGMHHVRNVPAGHFGPEKPVLHGCSSGCNSPVSAMFHGMTFVEDSFPVMYTGFIVHIWNK